jgi:hypothetical protein
MQKLDLEAPGLFIEGDLEEHEENWLLRGIFGFDKLVEDFVLDPVYKGKRQLRKLRERVEKKMGISHTEKYFIMIDKFNYMIGVSIMFLTMALLFFPKVRYLTSFAIAINSILTFNRYLRYYMAGEHYFFYDYCYYVGTYCAIVIAFYSDNIMLMKIAFLHAGGSLPMSMIYLKSKLVFHNLEWFTSFYMHYIYFLVMYILRYWNVDESAGIIMPSEWQASMENFGIIEYLGYVGLAIATYMIWSLFYYIMIFHVKKDVIEKEHRETLYSYTLARGDFNSICMRYGKEYSAEMYMVWHLGSTSIAFFISALMMRYHACCLLGLFVYMLSPMYYGSNYYFNFFAKSYDRKVKERYNKDKDRAFNRQGTRSLSGKRKKVIFYWEM